MPVHILYTPSLLQQNLEYLPALVRYSHKGLPTRTNATSSPASLLALPCPLFLHLLSAPPSIRIPHIRRRLNARNELECHISGADKRDESACRIFPPIIAHDDAADEEVEDAAADKAEHEGGVAGDLGWDLKFCRPVLARGRGYERAYMYGVLLLHSYR